MFDRKLKDEENKSKAEMALQEAKFMQVFNHPNIVSLHEYYRPKVDVILLVLDHADDGSLEEHIEQRVEHGKPYGEEVAMNIFAQISLGLAYLHDRRVVHRNIKP